MDQPRWLAFAWADLSVSAIPGPANSPRVVRYFADAGHPEVASDEVAWCAAFAGACLERAGTPSTRSLMARSYLQWGTPLDDARTGAIAVLSRGSDPALGHVGFLIGETSNEVILLGGNQGHAVNVAAFPRSRLLGLRWPSDELALPAPQPPAAEPQLQRTPDIETALFARAMEHNLAMEGGYSEDPYDPGGPTNLGITLAEFARTRGVALTADNFASLKAALRGITRDQASAIYRADYWNAARCPYLPSAVALFHFDAAVNQGVFGAARMLQQALGVEVDGQIGPITLAAAARSQPLQALAAYAEARRAHYRSLSTFWRFGRGWLSRVDTTLGIARTIAADPRFNQPPPPPTETPPMPDQTIPSTPVTTPDAPLDSKWWGRSLTVWGVLITGLSTVLPAVGPLFGFNITADLIQQLGDGVVQFAQAAGGLAGTVLALWGRVRATAVIERRQFTMTL